MKQAKKIPNLTKIETKVLDLILSGKSNKEIALGLHCSIRTIEGRRYRIMHKFGAANFADLVKKSISSDFSKIAPHQIKENPLTATEKRVLTLILEGNSNREIAQKLNRSIRTVEEHRRKTMLKIGADDLIGLVKSSLKMGFFDDSSSRMLKKKPDKKKRSCHNCKHLGKYDILNKVSNSRRNINA